MLEKLGDTIAPENRREYRREAPSRYVLDATHNLTSYRRRDLGGHLWAITVGSAAGTATRPSASVSGHVEDDSTSGTNQSIYIVHVIAGFGHLQTNKGVEKIDVGDMIVGLSCKPSLATSSETFRYRMISIPMTQELALDTVVDDLVVARVDSSIPIAPAMKALFTAIQTKSIPQEKEATALVDLGRLALAARGLLPPAKLELRKAMRHSLYYAALDIMQQMKGEQGLVPEGIAGILGISRRQLFTVFEEAGASFAKTLSEMRVRSAHQWLIEQPKAHVVDVAFGCGFESVPTFYRVFSNYYGQPPGRMRRCAAS